MVPDGKIVFDVFLGSMKDTPLHLAGTSAKVVTAYSDRHHAEFTPVDDLLIVAAEKGTP